MAAYFRILASVPEQQPEDAPERESAEVARRPLETSHLQNSGKEIAQMGANDQGSVSMLRLAFSGRGQRGLQKPWLVGSF